MVDVGDPLLEQENPLLEGLSLRRAPDACALVIFGASGDLTHKKLMPALYALMLRRLLPPRFAIVASPARGDDDRSRRHEDAVRSTPQREFRDDVWNELAASLLHPDRLCRRGGQSSPAARSSARSRPRRQPRLLPRRAPGRVSDDRGRPRQTANPKAGRVDRRAVRPRPRVGLAQHHAVGHFAGRRSSGSTTTSARRSRTCSRSLPRRHLRADLESPVHRPRAVTVVGRSASRARGYESSGAIRTSFRTICSSSSLTAWSLRSTQAESVRNEEVKVRSRSPPVSRSCAGNTAAASSRARGAGVP